MRSTNMVKIEQNVVSRKSNTYISPSCD